MSRIKLVTLSFFLPLMLGTVWLALAMHPLVTATGVVEQHGAALQAAWLLVLGVPVLLLAPLVVLSVYWLVRPRVLAQREEHHSGSHNQKNGAA